MVIGNALIQAIFLSIVNLRLRKLQKLQLKTPPSALWDVSHRPGVCWGQIQMNPARKTSSSIFRSTWRYRDTVTDTPIDPQQKTHLDSDLVAD